MSIRLTDKASVPAVVAEMTLEEKARLVTGEFPFTTAGIKRLGIPPMRPLDGHTGINMGQLRSDMASKTLANKSVDELGEMSGPAISGFGTVITNAKDPAKRAKMAPSIQKLVQEVLDKVDELMPDGMYPGCFPPGIMQGSTWNPEVIEKEGSAVGKEMDAYKVDVCLGPNVNIHRDPLNGRLFEGYSEDPYVTATLAPYYIRGMQAEGVAADAKHFAANNQETHRQEIDERIPLRALYEIYLPGFKAAVQQGKVKTLMSAYNKINGTACALNHWLLTDVLRGEWGFEGFVVSDWGAVYDQVDAINAGNDLEMPGPLTFDKIVAAVKDGRIDEKTLDQRVANYLNVLVELPVMKGRKNAHIDREYSRKAAYDVAAEGSILLKNEGALPLKEGAKISLIGEHAKDYIICGKGSAFIDTDQATNLYDCAVETLGADKVEYGDVSADSDAAIIVVSVDGQEGSDRADLLLAPGDDEMILDAAKKAHANGKKAIVILNVTGPVEMEGWLDQVDAVLCVWLPGMEGGRATLDILTGKVNPSGKLTLTFPKHYYDCPTYGNFPGDGDEVWYGEGIYVGYRYYDKKHVEPLYPFGYGLSYTTFELSDIAIDRDVMDMDKGEIVNVSVKVTNTGKVAGKEVVQVYISDEVSTLSKPLKELKGFQKVALQPGESKVVTIAIGKDRLASYDPAAKAWGSEPGYYQALVGTSSRDIAGAVRFKAVGYNPFGYGANCSIGKIMANPAVVEAMKKYIPAHLLSDESMSSELTYFPEAKLQKIWNEKFSLAFKDKSETEKQAILDAMCAEIAKIEVI